MYERVAYALCVGHTRFFTRCVQNVQLFYGQPDDGNIDGAAIGVALQATSHVFKSRSCLLSLLERRYPILFYYSHAARTLDIKFESRIV